MNKPVLSIITINFNNYSGLLKTIKSVINQGYKSFEFIVIDGSSTDGSLDIIKQYSGNISYWISEPDSGIYNAMNKGILQASGEYCLFLNSGDYFYDNNVLDSVFKFKFEEDLVYGQQYIYKGEYILSAFLEPEYITFKSFLKSTLPHQCTFIKRQLFEIVGLYNENNKIVSDWEFNLLALFKYNCSLKKIDLPIAVFDLSGISNKQDSMELHQKEKIIAISKHFPRIFKDYQYYFNIERKYFGIPKPVRKFFSLLHSYNKIQTDF
ncbi:MAG TPA: glycosyltransferase family 2 protein [Bacteroidales bacterium]|jgi:glycosyltransferase involved in cell wall biosynthesis|nr:glycosyltransferase family 2 protein [Bacteroidales bacterium]